MNSIAKKGYKQTDVGVIPEDWEVKLISEAFEIHNHLRLPLSEVVRKQMQGEFPYYGPTKIQDYINEYRVEGKYALIGEDGDHFLKWSEFPMTQIASGKFNVNNHAHLVTGKNKKTLTEWFHWFFKHRDITQHLTRQGAGRYKLSKATLLKIPCAIPIIKEQSAIAEVLTDTDNLVANLAKLIAKKEAIKKGTMQQLLTGKKRLPGLKNNWRVKAIDELADIDTDNLNSNTNADYVFNYISLEDVDYGVLKNYSEQEFATAPSRARRKIKQYDILFATVRPNLKSHLFIKNRMNDFVCSTGFSVIRCRQGIAHPVFVYQHLFAYQIESQINKLLSGSNYPSINSKEVKSLEISIPDYETQEAIAKIFTDMDDEISQLNEKLSKYKMLKNGLMQTLLTGKIRLI